MNIELEDLECYAITHWNFVRVIKETEIKQKYELIIVFIFSQIKFNSENKLVESFKSWSFCYLFGSRIFLFKSLR